MNFGRWGWAMLMLSVSHPAVAGSNTYPLPLEQLLQVEVSGASRFSQPLSEAPAAVTVVSAEDVRGYGIRTLGEALQFAPGVFVTDDRDYLYLGIRGLNRPGDYNSRILLLADGAMRNDLVYNQAMVGNESPLEIDWIKQLEFVPGPASALYGGNALFGIVNAVLWSGADIDGTRVSGAVESGGRVRVGFLSGGRGEAGVEWVTGLVTSESHGFNPRFPEFAGPGTGDGTARNLDGERYLKAFAKLNIDAWQLGFSAASRRKNVPTAYYGTLFGVPGNYTEDQSVYLDASRSRVIAPEWSDYLHFHSGATSFTGQYVYPTTLNRDEARGLEWGGDYRLAYTGLARHRVMIGLDATVQPRLDQRNLDLSPRFAYLDDHHRSGRLGLFIQDQWRLTPGWIANLGIRADRVKDFGAIASPRVALIREIDATTEIKAIHGRAFRVPNAYEHYYNDGNVTQKANPDLKAERMISSEIVASHMLLPDVRIGASAYRYRIERFIDLITDPTDGLATFVNRNALVARGIELQTDAMLGRFLRVRGNVAWQRLSNDGVEPVNSPHRLAKLFVDGPLFGTPWRAGLSLQWIDRRNTLADAVPGHGSGNLTLNRRLPGNAGEISVGVRNLAGKRYFDPTPFGLTQDALPQDRRQISLRWDFTL